MMINKINMKLALDLPAMTQMISTIKDICIPEIAIRWAVPLCLKSSSSLLETFVLFPRIRASAIGAYL